MIDNIIKGQSTPSVLSNDQLIIEIYNEKLIV